MKIKFITLGCKVNQYETQSLREIFLAKGFEETFAKADFYFINTCSVTHSADRKSIKYIRKAKRENPQAKILVTGCLAEKDKELIEKEKVDYIVPQSQKYKIPSILNLENKLNLENNLSLKITDFYLNRAFVKIQDGCDNFCSFCKIRLIRGKSKSRPAEEVVREVKFLLEKGFKEIVLCGINLGSYNYQGKDLISLLKLLVKIKSLGRLRLSSIEPQYVSKELLNLISSTEKICPHLHIPFQSGSDKILKLMNKKVKSSFYRELVSKIKKIIPDCGISADFIIGFPYEEEDDFKKTIRLIEEINPVRSHIFPYSERRQTPSFKFPKISSRIVRERKEIAIQVGEEASFRFRKSQEKKRFKVVLEENPKKGYSRGYTENYIRVLLKGAFPSKGICSKSLIPIVIDKVTSKITYARLLK
ncbi:MAG: tRNA (N(6)-L-threonylcarbamoyladenosine(37)-C(2))-methylthiotransferase MtaB [Candidatus Omnitrophica bacterium]|nr:tRNA (N(6)-L-threonylcarbamoyladenosine(37)-C(2))-methylthiotransferase MtaB [Candidatus Omnitrophota bacterium]